MDRRAAKEVLHIKGWLERVEDVIRRGKTDCLADAFLGRR